MTNVSQESLATRDVLVVGSGSPALSAALRASAASLSVRVFEKTSLIGGTSAMSGAGTWIPANHYAREAGLEDSVEEAITYLRAASPADWESEEGPHWTAFARAAPRMLEFVEKHTPLRFALTEEPDVMPERPGGKIRGRMLSPAPLSKRILSNYVERGEQFALAQTFGPASAVRSLSDSGLGKDPMKRRIFHVEAADCLASLWTRQP